MRRVHHRGAPRGLLPALLLTSLAACRAGPADETFCSDAEARLGHRVCVQRIRDGQTWTEVTFPAAAVDQARATAYLVPARDDARVPTVFVDANAFETPEQSLHFHFLTESFPEFEALEYAEYVELITDPDAREWFAGSLTEYIFPEADSLFGFTVSDGGGASGGTITCAQFESIHAELDGRIKAGKVVVVPANQTQAETLADCDVPSYDPSTALDYEPYHKATGCGTLRRYTASELAQAELEFSFGWQDVLVVDEAPFDIETVISGIVTGTRQGELSHLNVRSASRGTPNCYVKDAYALMESWEGQLVQLECGPTEATVVAITPEQAQTCWENIKPDPVDVPPPDLAWTDLVPLLDLPTQSAAERATALTRFGAKGTNLATLYQRIDSALQLEGFLIPVHYYDRFVRDNTWSVDLGNGVEELSYQATLERLLDDPDVLADGALRRTRLEELQAAMRATSCDPALLAAIETEVLAIFGSPEVMVRFRSSSNAEDAIDFTGAGLYDSTSGCVADENDADALGPSHCDPDKDSEREVCRALTKVWASLWNFKAFEERAWYGIDQSRVAMGILVDTRTKGELANIVAFTGNPLLAGDDRYLVNAQLGELDVVSAVPGVWPEKELLTLEDGVVTLIERERGSTELPEGEWVLDDAHLKELGATLWQIEQVYPVDADVPPTARVHLDTEWKVRSDGSLVIKQVRPFIE